MAAIFFTSEVISNKKLNYKFRLIKLKFEESQDIFQFKPGQFTVLKIETGVYRSYSIASHPSKLPYWQILVDITPGGPGSTLLKKLKKGQNIQHSSAKGAFYLRIKSNAYNIMAATGCGIASIIPMIEELLRKDKKIYLFWGLRYKKDICYINWLKTLARNQNFSYQIVLSKPQISCSGITGHLTAPLIEFASTMPQKKLSAYLCGNRSMISDVINALRVIISDKKRIHFESYY